jgi:hypothetical protein
MGQFPTGSNLSHYFANMFLYGFDLKMSKMAEQFGMVYSRYVDDITFSTKESVFNQKTNLEARLDDALNCLALQRNVFKTKWLNPSYHAFNVTGLDIRGKTPRVPSKYIKEVVEPRICYDLKSLLLIFRRSTELPTHLVGVADTVNGKCLLTTDSVWKSFFPHSWSYVQYIKSINLEQYNEILAFIDKKHSDYQKIWEQNFKDTPHKYKPEYFDTSVREVIFHSWLFNVHSPYPVQNEYKLSTESAILEEPKRCHSVIEWLEYYQSCVAQYYKYAQNNLPF